MFVVFQVIKVFVLFQVIKVFVVVFQVIKVFVVFQVIKVFVLFQVIKVFVVVFQVIKVFVVFQVIKVFVVFQVIKVFVVFQVIKVFVVVFQVIKVFVVFQVIKVFVVFQVIKVFVVVADAFQNMDEEELLSLLFAHAAALLPREKIPKQVTSLPLPQFASPVPHVLSHPSSPFPPAFKFIKKIRCADSDFSNRAICTITNCTYVCVYIL